MLPEQQQIAIVKACRWKMEAITKEKWQSPTETEIYIVGYTEPPNYLSDLNAMHEAEKVMTKEQRRKYVRALYQLTKSEFENHCATAAQRAEAFLRTLNLWED